MWAENDLCPEKLQSCAEPTDGKVYRMYHGTSREAATEILINGFKPSANGMLGRGVYLSRDLNKASRYPLELPEHLRFVIRVNVHVGRVKRIDFQGHPMQKTWHYHGYDTAWCPPNCGMVPSGLEEDCVWDPSRIKVIDVIQPRQSLAQQVKKKQQLYIDKKKPTDGKVYRMYHGTSREAATEILINGFKPSANGMLGRGVYLSRDLNKASRYPLELPERLRVVIRVNVHVGRVKRIDFQGHPLQKTWHDHGYDTAWCPPNCGMVPSGLEEDCVWDPSHIQVIDVIQPRQSLAQQVKKKHLWAEDDLGPEVPCLKSCSQPIDGKVYIMYHGTSREAAAKIMINGFEPSADGMLGHGVYLSRDLNKASRYPLELPENLRVVLKVRVKVGKVKKIDHQGHPLQKTWHDHGYDTAWCPPECGMVPSGLEEDCVWDPSRIKVIGVPCLESWSEPTDGKVYRMYHGTSSHAAAQIMKTGFKQSSGGMLGRGVYLSRDLDKASRYPLDLPEHQRVVIRVRVRVGKVKKIDHQGHPLQKTWHNHGYDTAWCPPGCGMVRSGLEEDCVWDPKRIEVIDVIRP
ncbi:hypothetical protein C0J45_13474, partial [Silurus meridionalis]